MNIFINRIKTALHDTEKAAEKSLPVAEAIAPSIPVIGSAVNPVMSLIDVTIHHQQTESSNMNPLEAMAVSMILGVLQTVIKNPAHKAALQTQLLGVAQDIYSAYGINAPLAPTPTAS